MPMSSPGASAVYRSLHADEWSQLRDLRLIALKDTPKAFLEPLRTAEQRDEAGWRRTFEDGTWHLAETGDGWVGLARTSTVDEAPEEYYLEAFWVAPDHRDRGIGRGLVEHIASRTGDEGKVALRLAVLNSNPLGVPVFAALGFVVEDEPSDDEQQMVYRVS